MGWITEDETSYFRQLDEGQQRLFAGLKAKTLGRSGVRLVSERFGIHAWIYSSAANYAGMKGLLEVELLELHLTEFAVERR